MHGIMCHHNTVTDGRFPFHPRCADTSPEYFHWIPSMSAQPLTPCWGGSSSRSHISQYGHQRSPVSTGGLARRHRVWSLTVMQGNCSAVCCTWQVSDLGLCLCACLLNLVRRRGEEWEVFASHPGSDRRSFQMA